MNNKPAIIPVLLCGGSGTRLWPLSTPGHPKQFLSLLNEQSLLQNTARRSIDLIKNITGEACRTIIAVTLAEQKKNVTAHLEAVLPDTPVTILPEPVARGTAAAILYAALHVKEQHGPDTALLVLPVDHHIGAPSALMQAWAKGLQAATQGSIVTFGIKPSRPETGYGYIRASTDQVIPGVPIVQHFSEKPDAQTAQHYLKSGEYFWNSGMFLFQTHSVLKEYQDHHPAMVNTIDAAYEALPNLSFDKAILEHSKQVAVVPCDPDWSDIGTWESLWDVYPKDSHNNARYGATLVEDTAECLIYGQHQKTVAAAGLEHLIIIDTPDALLIADRRKPESLHALLQRLSSA